MSKELQNRADEAWRMMIRAADPMPPAVALDFVQQADDERTERGSAAAAIHKAAAWWLSNKPPPAAPDEDRECAPRLLAALHLGHTATAEQVRVQIRDRASDVRLAYVLSPSRVEHAAWVRAKAWGEWCDYAYHAVRLCHQVAEAVHPPEPAAT